MNKITILFLLVMGSTLLQAQESYPYIPSNSKIESKKKFEERLEQEVMNDVAELESSSKNAKEIALIYTDRAAYIHQMALEDDEYIFNTPLNEYINNVFTTILAANPDLSPEDYQLFVSRDFSPNASCFGEGTLVINVGLIRRLENESQIAFVLSHELAHQIKDHVNNKIVDYVELKNSKDTQKQIKQIKNQKYNRNQAGLELLKGISYDSSRHGRFKEAESDSYALELLKNTNYDLSEAARALEILDTIDEEKYQNEIVLYKEFGRDLYPFKPEWTEDENPLEAFFSKDSNLEIMGLNADSLKTHPHCLDRAKSISSMAKQMNHTGQKNIQSVAAFTNAVNQADFDVVLSAYHYDNYGYAIYQALQLLQKYPDHPFLTGIIGLSMGEMVDALEHHELGKVLPLPSPEFDENYNELLTFLNKLTIREMQEVGWNYVAIYQDKAGESEALAYALALTAKEKNKMDLYNKYKNLFMKQFPNSYFIKQARKL